MKFQIVLLIFIMGINFSNNKAPKQHCYQSEKVYIKSENIPKLRSQRSLQKISPVIRPKQNGVCSTWGNFQYRTFDGAMYRFAGICNYLFAAHCGSHYEDFNIQIEQSWDESLPTVSQLSVKLNELLIEVNDHNPSISGELIDLPYSHNGIRIEKIETVLHISAKFLLELTWEESNIIHLTLNKKYMGETCGLCGNYNGNANDDIVYEVTSTLTYTDCRQWEHVYVGTLPLEWLTELLQWEKSSTFFNG
ncbi:mucin-6-like [Engystomops pustulosus]|uniref:mucin-6-like n=1 Tax=Engystomops pustulosus TaxID=76066 RepID=UPI003AFA8B01